MLSKRTIIDLMAVLIGLSAFSFGIYTYYQSTRPHTQFEEIKAKLSTVEQRLNEAEDIRGYFPPEVQQNLAKARTLLSSAERAWIEGHYDEAQRLLGEAYVLIPLFKPGPSMLPMIVLIVSAVIGLLLGSWIGYMRVKKA